MIEKIREFLACRRVAVVGVSHEPREFSRMVYRALRERGYDVVPVNPNVRKIEADVCYARVQDVKPSVESALVITPPAVSEDVVKDCAAAGVTRIWLYRFAPAAEAWCAAHGIAPIAGECPMMFLERPGIIHRVHGWFRHGAPFGSGMLRR